MSEATNIRAALERAEARIVALEDECVVLRSGVTAETVRAEAAEARAARLAEAGERLLCHDIHAHSCSLCEPMHSALADDSSEAWLDAKLRAARVEGARAALEHLGYSDHESIIDSEVQRIVASLEAEEEAKP